MAEIKFDRFSQQFDRVYSVVHFVGMGLAVVLGLFAAFSPSHYVFFPPIFFIGFVIFGMSAAKRLFVSRRTKNSSKMGLFYLIVSIILLFFAIFIAMCFWT